MPAVSWVSVFILVAVVVPAASVPVTDAKEGLALLEKLRVDCGVYLEGSPEQQAALMTVGAAASSLCSPPPLSVRPEL